VKFGVAVLIIAQRNIKWLGTIGGWVVVYVLYCIGYIIEDGRGGKLLPVPGFEG